MIDFRVFCCSTAFGDAGERLDTEKLYRFESRYARSIPVVGVFFLGSFPVPGERAGCRVFVCPLPLDQNYFSRPKCGFRRFC